MLITRFHDHEPRFLKALHQAASERAHRRRVKLRHPSWKWPRFFDSDAVWNVALVLMAVFGFSRLSEGPQPLNRGAIEGGYALIALFFVATVERSISGLLTRWPDLLASLHLPTTDVWMVRRQWGRGTKRLIYVSLAILLGASLVVVRSHAGWPGTAAALLFVILLSAVVLSLATWVASTRRGGLLSGCLWGLLITFWIGSKLLPDLAAWLTWALNRAGEWLVLLVPTGWVIRPFHGLLGGGGWQDWVSLLPATLLVLSLPTALARLASRRRIRDHALLEFSAQVPDDASDEFREAVANALVRPAPPPPEEMRRRVLDRGFLDTKAAPSPRHWLQILLWRSWTPRERLLAEFAFGELPNWSKRFAVSAGVLVLALGAGILGARLEIGWLQAAWIVAGAILVIVLTPVSPAMGRLSYSWMEGQGSILSFGLFPLGFPELSRWALKSAKIRLLLGSPLALLSGAGFGFAHPDLVSPGVGAQCMGAVLICILGLQPLWLVGTIFGQKSPQMVGPGRHFGGVSLLAIALVWVALSSSAVFATALAHPAWGFGLALGSWATGLLGLRWITWLIGRGRVELLIRSDSSSG